MDRSLLEYAVMNIAEEVAGPMFELWTCIDIHNYLVIIAKPRPEMSVERRNETVSRVLSQIQHLVLHYLKENISLVYGQCEKFPHDLTTVYEEALHTLRKKIGSDGGMLLRAGQPHPAAIQHIASLLHAPPSISHLFSAGLWDDAREKLSEVFAACEEAFMEANLHADALAEIYHSIISACYSYAHKNGQSISDALACEDTPEFYSSGELTQSVTLLKEWSLDICRRLSQSNQVEMQDVRESVIKAIQEYIHVHLSEDVSLQTLADHVDLHPVYLSKVYKLVTGESLKDYVFQARMDRAKHLLEQTDHKIYEISSEIGYLNTAYFIKVFKRQYGFTPQEYRERRNEQVMR